MASEKKMEEKKTGKVLCLISEEYEQLSRCDFEKAAGNLKDYPYVYIHIWDEDGARIYIGVSIDPVGRNNQHRYTGNTEYFSWQRARKEGKNHCSYYFTSEEMNLSLAFDIENCLIESIEQSDILKGKPTNGRKNPQRNYSNKNQLESVLADVLAILNEDWGLSEEKQLKIPESAAGFSNGE